MAAKKRGSALLVFFIVIVILFAAVAGGFLWLRGEVDGARRASDPVTVEIPQGASTEGIANRLKQAGAIGSTTVFRAYSRIIGADGSYQYGSFSVIPSEGYDAIIKTLQTVQNFEEYVNITIPEGLNGWQVADIVAESGLCTAEEFLDAISDPAAYDYAFLPAADALDLMPLDGFLYPETYSFFTDATAHDIVDKLLAAFEERVLTAENRKLIEQSGYTMRELASLAAIVQRESFADDIMDDVAGVFINRLQPGSGLPFLQSDTTNFYINNFIQPQYNGSAPDDLLMHYDSYGVQGIPAGVIASPGLAAYEAVLRPAESDYYFFVTDVEYNYYFGKTMAEHESNIQKAISVNRTHGIDGLA